MNARTEPMSRPASSATWKFHVPSAECPFSAASGVSGRHVPVNALLFSCMFLLSSLVLLFSGETVLAAFTLVTTISALLFMFVWTMILVSYMAYRRKRPDLHAASRFKMPGGVPMCWAVLAFFVFILWALTQQADTLQALLVTPVWFVALGIAWSFVRGQPRHLRQYEAFQHELAEDPGVALASTTGRG